MGFLLQSLAARLGVATGRHLAEHCREVGRRRLLRARRGYLSLPLLEAAAAIPLACQHALPARPALTHVPARPARPRCSNTRRAYGTCCG